MLTGCGGVPDRMNNYFKMNPRLLHHCLASFSLSIAQQLSLKSTQVHLQIFCSVLTLERCQNKDKIISVHRKEEKNCVGEVDELLTGGKD